MEMPKGRRIALYVATLVLGYAAFIAPNLLFGITGINGGLSGPNLALIGLIQLALIAALLSVSLRLSGRRFIDIGWRFDYAAHDIALGLAIGSLWTAVQVLWLIPATGGTARPDVEEIVAHTATPLALASYIALGVIGGGVAEELFNRGYTIGTLAGFFRNRRTGLAIAAAFSILLFCAGHLPTDLVEWVDILIPTLAYTALYLATGRLLPGIAAHATYNAAILIALSRLYG
ncbi:CPBP family intramembrane glutamic endopeptidase [Pseudoroseicyclus sp. H15]